MVEQHSELSLPQCLMLRESRTAAHRSSHVISLNLKLGFSNPLAFVLDDAIETAGIWGNDGLGRTVVQQHIPAKL